MAQISYGTITITDTNDVESIVVEYNRNKSTTTPPVQTDSGWSTNRPTWAQDYYIWQRTRTHKSGTQASEDTLGNAVCITGSTGQSGTPGKGITGIETLYATNNSTTTAPTSASEWQPQPPTYNSSKPKYWVKVTTTYSVGEPTVVTYLDNGITDAMATAAAANSSATEALSKTQAKYATSSTGATIPAKVAVFNPAVATWSLFNGAEIFVKFTNKNEVANPTLSVKPSSSGSGTAAKTIRDSDGNALDSKFYWGANSLVHFVYDGTYWRILDIVTTAKYNNMVSDIDDMSSTIGAHTTRLNGLDALTTTHETKITQTANSITSLVSNEETYTKPDGTTGTNEIYSAIKQNEDNINLKVDKNGVIAAINLSTETSGGSTAKISADKVNIEGATIFTSGRLSSESLNNTYDPKGSIYDSGNMLLDAYAPSLTKINAKYNRYFSDVSNTSTVCSFVSAGDETLPDPNAKYFVRIKNTKVCDPDPNVVDKATRGLAFYGSNGYENAVGMVVGDTYKASCWVRQLPYDDGNGNQIVSNSNFTIGNGGFVADEKYTDLTFIPTTEWQKYERVFTFSDYKSASTNVWSRLYFYNLAGNGINGAGTGIGQIDMCGFKLERINAIASSGRNLCLRSADYKGWSKNNGTTFDGNIITFPTVTTNTWREAWQNNNVPYSTVRNQKVTVTYKVKGTSGDLIQSFVCFSLVATATDSSRLKHVNKYVTLTANGEWQTVAFSAYINDHVFSSGTGTPDYDNCYFMIRVGATGATDGRNGFQMKEIMVALGSDPCAWSPAPEDSVAYTDESVNAIEISGRNILRDSETMASMWYANTNATISDGVATLTGISSAWSAELRTSKYDASIYDGAESVISFDYKSTVSCDIHRVYAGTNADKDSDAWSRTKYIGKTFTIPSSGGEWKRYVMPVTKISIASLTTGSGDVVSGYLQFYNRTDNGVFQMRHIKFEKGNKVTQWSPAPEDMVAQEQRIYYRTNTTNKPDAPSTWVSSINTVNNDWTTKRMEYDKDYKYLFTCIQRQAIGGAITHTDVLLDDTTTVIDGGNIITGSVTTNQLATDAIKSLDYGAPASGSQFSTKGTFFNLADQGEFRSKNFAIDKNGNAYFNGALTATSLTIAPGATFDGDIDRFKGASFNWNLLLGTATPVTWSAVFSSSGFATKDCYKTITPVPSLFAVGDLVTISFDWQTDATGGNFHVECGNVTPYTWGNVVKAEGGRSSTNSYVDISSTNQSGHFIVTYRITDAQTGAAQGLQWLRIRVDGADANGKSFTISNAKAERGSLASDWCTAESEIHGTDGKDGISAVGLAMKVNYSGFATASGGECYFHGYNNQNEEADVNGWVIWNGEKLTITKGMWINPNGAVPVNTPIFHVFRTSASPYHSDVWWDSSLLTWRGYAYTADKVPGTKANWTWNEATDCILAVYVATGNEAITSAQLFTTPKKFSELPDPDNIHNIVDTSIDGIEIGGRNLLQGTANPQISSSYLPPYYEVLSGGNGVGSIESIEDSPVTGVTRTFRITGNTTGNRDFVQRVDDFSTLWTDGQWIFSCYVRGIGGDANVYIRVYTGSANTFAKTIPVQTTWARIECPIKLNGTGSQSDPSHMQFGITGAGSIEYIAPMLERGTKASAWSYAPEDVQANIDSVNTTVTGVRADLTTTQDSLSRVENTANAAEGTANNAYTLANTANGKADEANRKYDSISGIVNDYNNLRNYYLDFDPNPGNGLVIGAKNTDGSENAFKTQITNEEVAFLQGDNKVAWIGANLFYIRQGVIKSELRVGNFVIFDEEGALNIKYEPLS